MYNCLFQNLKYTLQLPEYSHGVVSELLRYIYTDKVDNLDKYSHKLLPISTKFQLPGLTALCERSLIESLKPTNVPNVLLLADQCGCENLRKAALHYCENSEEIKDNVQIGKFLVSEEHFLHITCIKELITIWTSRFPITSSENLSWYHSR